SPPYPPAPIGNQPPSALAGYAGMYDGVGHSADGGAAPLPIYLPGQAYLTGVVMDDGLPAPAALTLDWSMMSGPGTVTFGDPHAANTTASFSQPGTYVLGLSVSDGDLTGTSQVTIPVNPVGSLPVPNFPTYPPPATQQPGTGVSPALVVRVYPNPWRS